MGKEQKQIYQKKTFVYQWGTGHLTFTQLIDGSKAAWCPEDDTCYWLYFDANDKELTMPVAMLEMSEGEEAELELHDIICDLIDANHRGMYPEVSAHIRQLLVERSVRRETIFALNTVDTDLIKDNKGITYLVSRQALQLLNGETDPTKLRMAVGMAIRNYMRKPENNE